MKFSSGWNSRQMMAWKSTNSWRWNDEEKVGMRLFVWSLMFGLVPCTTLSVQNRPCWWYSNRCFNCTSTDIHGGIFAILNFWVWHTKTGRFCKYSQEIRCLWEAKPIWCFGNSPSKYRVDTPMYKCVVWYREIKKTKNLIHRATTRLTCDQNSGLNCSHCYCVGPVATYGTVVFWIGLK